MLVQMTVRGIALDPITNMPIIILKDVDERKALPIWVGIFEANAIALELEKVTTPRPMTHDLLKSVLDGLGVTVRQVIVNDLKDNTFFAVIELNHNGTVINRGLSWACSTSARSRGSPKKTRKTMRKL